MRRENAKNSSESVDPDQEHGESFLGRWSRRKQRARTQPEEQENSASPAIEQQDGDTPEEVGQERALTDDDMPPLESLDADSDYSGFLSPGVSESLRNAALRKMFLSPKYNFTDGLDDYADDFTKFEPLGDIITADMRHQMELAEERAKKAMEEELAASDETASEQATDAENAAERDDEDVPAASAEQSADANDGHADGQEFGDPPDDETRSS